jgi:hypothetical protein
MKIRVIAAAALALAITLPVQANAQLALTTHGGYDIDVKELIIGAGVEFSIAGLPLTFAPGFDYYPGLAGASFFIMDFDAHYPFAAKGLTPYIGGGMYVSRVSVDIPAFGSISDTNVGLNLKGGASFGTSSKVRPFTEARLRMGNSSTLILKAGLSIKLGS